MRLGRGAPAVCRRVVRDAICSSEFCDAIARSAQPPWLGEKTARAKIAKIAPARRAHREMRVTRASIFVPPLRVSGDDRSREG